MKFRVYMKDPDVLQDGIEEAVDEDLQNSGLDEEEQDAIRDIRSERAQAVASKWFQYGEYLMVEIDTEKETIRVVPVSEQESERYE